MGMKIKQSSHYLMNYHTTSITESLEFTREQTGSIHAFIISQEIQTNINYIYLNS